MVRKKGIDLSKVAALPKLKPKSFDEFFEWISQQGEAAAVVVIDSALAGDILEKLNSRNRDPQSAAIYRWAREMQQGEWRFNGDTLVFSNGRTKYILIDGQHRLAACFLSGVSIAFLVVRGVSMEVQSTIDIGPPRSQGQTMKIAGYNYAPQRAAVSNKLLDPKATSVFSIKEKIAFHDAHAEAVDFVIENFYKSGTVPSVTQAPVATAIARAWHYFDDLDKLQRFCVVLRSGITTGAHEAAVVPLRDFLIKGRGKGERKNSLELFLKTQAAIRAFMKGKPLRIVHRVENDLFPLPEIDPQRGIANGSTNRSIHHYRAKYPPSLLPARYDSLRETIKDAMKELRKRGMSLSHSQRRVAKKATRGKRAKKKKV